MKRRERRRRNSVVSLNMKAISSLFSRSWESLPDLLSHPDVSEAREQHSLQKVIPITAKHTPWLWAQDSSPS